MNTTAMPDITAMQKIVGALTAVVTAGLTSAASVGYVTVDQETKFLALWGALSAFALTADAIIRQGRAKHLAIVKAAEITAAAAPAPATPVVVSPPAAVTRRATKPKASTKG